MAAYSFAAFLVVLQVINPLMMAVSVKMPKECENMSYCTVKGDYPYGKVNELNKGNRLPSMVWDTNGTYDVGHRLSDDSDFTSRLCPYTEKNATIYYILDTEKRVRVVVQLPNVFEQVFSLQKCHNEGAVEHTVDLITTDVSKSTAMYCKNIYYQYEFFVLNDDMTKLEKAYNFDGVPVACACKYSISRFTERGNLIPWNENDDDMD